MTWCTSLVDRIDASTARVALLWFLLALAVGILFSRAALPGIAPASDLWDYSQEARQIARGEGFTSLYTYPLFLGASSSSPYPVLWRMPLYALLGALLLKLGIALPAGFLYLGAFAHALLVALTYLLGAKVHSTRAGSWAAACALASPLLLDFYNAGMSQVAAAVLGLLVWILLFGLGSVVTTVIAAVAAAAAWYLRGESMLFLPLWLWVAARPLPERSPRWSRALVFLLAYAVLCLPWMIALGLQILAMAALERSPRFLVPALPLVFVMLGVAAASALGKVASSRALTALLLLVILERGAHVLYQRRDAFRRYPPIAASAA